MKIPFEVIEMLKQQNEFHFGIHHNRTTDTLEYLGLDAVANENETDFIEWVDWVSHYHCSDLNFIGTLRLIDAQKATLSLEVLYSSLNPYYGESLEFTDDRFSNEEIQQLCIDHISFDTPSWDNLPYTKIECSFEVNNGVVDFELTGYKSLELQLD